MKIRLLEFLKVLIIVPCVLIGLFFSLRLGLFSYSSRDFNCNKFENSCKIVSRYLLSDKTDIQSIKISDIQKVITEYNPNPKGYGHYVLNIYTKDKVYTYLEVGAYFRRNVYNCSGIISNFLASEKNNLNLSYKISAFKSVMGLLFALCIILPTVLIGVFKLDVKKYFEISKENHESGHQYLTLLPLSISMLLFGILSIYILHHSPIAYERQIGTAVSIIYVVILLLITMLSWKQVFSPKRIVIFFKRKSVYAFCSGMLGALIIFVLLLVLIYGLGVVSLYMC